MKYSHKDHAGGKADKWKHEMLTKALHSALRNSSGVFTYVDTHCAYKSYMINDQEYLGSWARAQQILSSREYLMYLYDTSDEVEKDIDDTDVIFSKEDGFDAAKNQCADFIFIDPPYTDEKDWGEIIYIASLTDTSLFERYMIWYPIMDGGLHHILPDDLNKIEFLWGGDKKMKGCGVITDIQTYREIR